MEEHVPIWVADLVTLGTARGSFRKWWHAPRGYNDSYPRGIARQLIYTPPLIKIPTPLAIEPVPFNWIIIPSQSIYSGWFRITILCPLYGLRETGRAWAWCYLKPIAHLTPQMRRDIRGLTEYSVSTCLTKLP